MPTDRRPPRPEWLDRPGGRRQEPDVFDVLGRSRSRLEAALADVIRADADDKRARLIAEQQERERVESEAVEALRRAFEAAEQAEPQEPEQELQESDDDGSTDDADAERDAFLSRLFPEYRPSPGYPAGG